jgi:hypothetical protein
MNYRDDQPAWRELYMGNMKGLDAATITKKVRGGVLWHVSLLNAVVSFVGGDAHLQCQSQAIEMA